MRLNKPTAASYCYDAIDPSRAVVLKLVLVSNVLVLKTGWATFTASAVMKPWPIMQGC